MTGKADDCITHTSATTAFPIWRRSSYSPGKIFSPFSSSFTQRNHFHSFPFLHSGNSLFFSLPPTLQSAHVSDLKSEIGTALRHHSTGNSSNRNGFFNSQQAGGASAAGEHQPNEWRKATSTQDRRCRLGGAASLLGSAPLRTNGRNSEVNRNRRLTGPPERPAASHPEAPAKAGWNQTAAEQMGTSRCIAGVHPARGVVARRGTAKASTAASTRTRTAVCSQPRADRMRPSCLADLPWPSGNR